VGHQRFPSHFTGASWAGGVVGAFTGTSYSVRGVVDEISNAPKGDPARQAVERGMFKIVKTPIPPAEILAWNLGNGETAVLSYTLAHPDTMAVLDDDAAHRCARSLSLTMTGTLAIIILAKQHGLIESASQVLHALRAVNFRLEDSIISDALARTVGETWKKEK